MSREQNKLRQHIDECLEEREHREREPEDKYLDDLDELFWEWRQEDYWKDVYDDDDWEEQREDYDDRETEKEKWEREDYEDWLDWEESLGEPSFATFGGCRYPQGDVVNARNHLTGE